MASVYSSIHVDSHARELAFTKSATAKNDGFSNRIRVAYDKHHERIQDLRKAIAKEGSSNLWPNNPACRDVWLRAKLRFD